MASTWYIARNKQKFGPFPMSQLQQLATLGLVKPTEHVLEEGANRWVPATAIPGLFAAAPVAQRYWLSLMGSSLGPFPPEQIRVALLRRQITGETLACPEGSKQWTPLAGLAEFQACFASATRSPSASGSHASLGVGSSHMDLNAEEAELHLAGKKGDQIAKLLSTLFDMRRRYRDNAPLVEVIERNIQDLKAVRERGLAGVGGA